MTTNYPESNDPREGMAGGTPPYEGAPGPESHSGSTSQMPPPQGGQGWEQRRYDQQWEPGYQNQRQRPHLKVRSTFLTTEFWVFVVVALGTLIAAAFTDDDDGLGAGFGAHDAWKYVTWLAIGYMLSRGLTKLGGNRRDGGDGSTRV